MEIPMYEVIRADLESQIRSGLLKVGHKLPTELQLQKQYNVSRSVPQRALNELAQLGLVARQKGSGTYVTHGSQELNLLRSIDPSLGDAGVPGYLKVISADVLAAGDAKVRIPELSDHDPVNQLIRVRYQSEDIPLGVEVSVTPFRLAPRLFDNKLQTTSIRAYLASQGVRLARSRMYLEPTALEQTYADLLGVQHNIPVLKRRRHMWQANGETAEVTAYYMKPREITFYIEYPEASIT